MAEVSDPKSSTAIAGWLRQFGERAGLPDFVLDSNGIAAFRYRSEFEIVIEYPGGPVLFLRSTIGRLPDEPVKRGALCEKLLRLHFIGRATHGATVMLPQNGTAILLVVQLPVALLDAGNLENALLQFMNAVVETAAQLREGDDVSPTKDEAASLDAPVSNLPFFAFRV